MPHLTLEYTRNLTNFDPTRTLAALNQAMADSGLFSEPDIKSRALALETFQAGISPAPRAFAHARIAMLTGRTSEERKTLADAVLAALTAAVAPQKGTAIQLSVETVDIDRPSYDKTILND
jgi:5-carboxymethyl-2-hydroxymuconate isomerase